MKLPLLVAARPRHYLEGPIVMLHQGSYIIEGDMEDSRFHIILDGITEEILEKDATIHLANISSVQVKIKDKGTENSISIYARQI